LSETTESVQTTNTQNIENKTKEIIEILKNTNEELTTLSKFSTED